ncbi:MAG: type VI secretion system baseplate subunit TssG, partial [Polyangia bacterium]
RAEIHKDLQSTRRKIGRWAGRVPVKPIPGQRFGIISFTVLPLHAKFQSLLPGGSALPKMAALVRTYVGDELHWDLRLILEEKVEEPFRLGQSRLSWTAWLGKAFDARREDLVLDPQTEVAQSVMQPVI